MRDIQNEFDDDHERIMLRISSNSHRERQVAESYRHLETSTIYPSASIRIDPWLRPHKVNLVEGKLEWNFPDTQVIRPIHELLGNFLNLENADDDGVCRFVEEWGILGLTAQMLPRKKVLLEKEDHLETVTISMTSQEADRLYGGKPGYHIHDSDYPDCREEIESYRRTAKYIRCLLDVGAKLRAQQPLDINDIFPIALFKVFYPNRERGEGKTAQIPLNELLTFDEITDFYGYSKVPMEIYEVMGVLTHYPNENQGGWLLLIDELHQLVKIKLSMRFGPDRDATVFKLKPEIDIGDGMRRRSLTRETGNGMGKSGWLFYGGIVVHQSLRENSVLRGIGVQVIAALRRNDQLIKCFVCESVIHKARKPRQGHSPIRDVPLCENPECKRIRHNQIQRDVARRRRENLKPKPTA